MIFWSSWGISLLLVVVVISPLLVKILAPYGTYDALVETEEENYVHIQNHKMALLKESVEAETKISNNIREQTAIFIDKQYRKVLEQVLTDESLDKVKEEMILNIAKIIEAQLSRRTQDISQLGLEINSSINDITNEVTRNEFKEKANFIAMQNRMNKIFEDIDDYNNEIMNSNQNNEYYYKSNT